MKVRDRIPGDAFHLLTANERQDLLEVLSVLAVRSLVLMRLLIGLGLWQ
jgi:hypothetical protein